MKKHIPNTITCCNLVSGCIAIVCALNGNSSMALLWIIIGAVFDFFDGMSARLLNVSSPIGKELDSLADDVTFGVAPSCIIFNFLCGYHQHNMFPPFVAFLIAAWPSSILTNVRPPRSSVCQRLPMPCSGERSS